MYILSAININNTKVYLSSFTTPVEKYKSFSVTENSYRSYYFTEFFEAEKVAQAWANYIKKEVSIEQFSVLSKTKPNIKYKAAIFDPEQKDLLEFMRNKLDFNFAYLRDGEVLSASFEKEPNSNIQYDAMDLKNWLCIDKDGNFIVE